MTFLMSTKATECSDSCRCGTLLVESLRHRSAWQLGAFVGNASSCTSLARAMDNLCRAHRPALDVIRLMVLKTRCRGHQENGAFTQASKPPTAVTGTAYVGPSKTCSLT